MNKYLSDACRSGYNHSTQLFKNYLSRINSWGVTGYRSFYDIGATCFFSMQIGIILPFRAITEGKADSFFANLFFPQKLTEFVKKSVAFILKPVDFVLTNFLQKPLGNLLGVLGLVLGHLGGILLGLLFKAPEYAKPTKDNAYFEKITPGFFGVNANELAPYYAWGYICVWSGVSIIALATGVEPTLVILGATIVSKQELAEIGGKLAWFGRSLISLMPTVSNYVADKLYSCWQSITGLNDVRDIEKQENLKEENFVLIDTNIRSKSFTPAANLSNDKGDEIIRDADAGRVNVVTPPRNT